MSVGGEKLIPPAPSATIRIRIPCCRADRSAVQIVPSPAGLTDRADSSDVVKTGSFRYLPRPPGCDFRPTKYHASSARWRAPTAVPRPRDVPVFSALRGQASPADPISRVSKQGAVVPTPGYPAAGGGADATGAHKCRSAGGGGLIAAP